MKICVFGLWHLGTVTAACLAAAGFDVVGLDSDASVVQRLSEGMPPLFEPGLEDLVRSGLAAGRLRFTTDASEALRAADIVWVAIDTPVDDDDRADAPLVVRRVESLFPLVRSNALMLISSQLPVGTTRRLYESCTAARGGGVTFAYSPENLRLGKAIETFTHPERVVVGEANAIDRDLLARLFSPFTDRILWMSAESAEMTKHALNAFLATSVTFINEIAGLCERAGADAASVAEALKSDSRIGPKAYLSPGAAFAGGTLARDVTVLAEFGASHGAPPPLLSAIKISNDAHRDWPQRRLANLLGGVAGKRIAVWGLTYKPGTDTLRRSSAIDLCRWIAAQGGAVEAHDPVVKGLPQDVGAIARLHSTPVDAARGADALVVATPWPEYRNVPPPAVVEAMAGSLVLDANRFLAGTLGVVGGLRYVSVGVNA